MITRLSAFPYYTSLSLISTDIPPFFHSYHHVCIASSCHTVLGRVIHAPDGQQGLVLPLIPPEYTILGGPPSFESVTRDVYPPTQRFSGTIIMRILKGKYLKYSFFSYPLL